MLHCNITMVVLMEPFFHVLTPSSQLPLLESGHACYLFEIIPKVHKKEKRKEYKISGTTAKMQGVRVKCRH